MEVFETYRPLLFSIAYRMLGSASDAEDMVQETYLRYRTTRQAEIRSLKSFLMTVVTRLCLDELKSAHVRREQYLGPWLPEPVLTEDAETLVEQRESLSLAFLTLLEELTPAERAVFVLHTAFDYPFDEIGQMLEKSATACRQLFHRAQERLAAHQRRFEPPPNEQQELVGRFLRATQSADVQGLTGLLVRDVVVWADGGGKVSAARRPVSGQEKVIRFVQGLLRKALADLTVSVETINGGSALLFWTGGTLFMVGGFGIADGQIHGIYALLNPDKLAYLQRQLRKRNHTRPAAP